MPDGKEGYTLSVSLFARQLPQRGSPWQAGQLKADC